MIQSLLVLALAANAAAQNVEQEKLEVIGWSKACSVAIGHYSYAKLGEGIEGDPILTRIGTTSIAPGEEVARSSWTVDWEGFRSHSPKVAARAISGLKKLGYTVAGFTETLRPDPVPEDWNLRDVLVSTSSFETRAPTGWPPEGWVLRRAHYPPLSTCALLLFADPKAEKDIFHPILVRIRSPAIRKHRAEAHLLYGLVLFQRGALQEALAEARIATVLDPSYAPAHYHRGRLLALTGTVEEAVEELEAAVKLDPKYKDAARADKADWEAADWHPRFKELTKR